jgi:ATP-binding cassette, subfamily B, bacterial
MRLPLRPYARLLDGYLRPQWPRVVLLALLLFGGIGLQLASPQIIRRFIDTAQAGGALRELGVMAALFAAVAVLQQGLSVLATYVGEGVGWTATNQLRADLALHVLRLDQSFHKQRTPGELIERIDGDVTALGSFFSQFVILVLGNAVLMAGVLILLFREDWRVGVALSLFAVLALLTLVRIRALTVPYWAALREASARFFGTLGEHLTATEDVRANGAAEYVLHRFYTLWRGLYPVQLRASLAAYSMFMASIGLFTLGTALAFGLGAYLWSLGAITVGTIYLIYNYTELLRQPIEQIRTQLQQLQQAGAGITRVQALLAVHSKLADTGTAEVPPGALAIACQHVTFGYDAPEPVLRDLSFDVAPGRVLGLLGRTGSGKTTLARLLLRLYDPDQGELYLGGVPARAARLASLRQRVGLVTQEVQLFQATVRDNLTFFDGSVPDAALLGVIAELGLSAWFNALPLGLDTPVDAGGSGLSAGEAQLLALARLFLRDPGLIVLDEASSRLDPATEALIERALNRLLSGRTAVIIAHRLGTVLRADEIMILDDGCLVEHGPRAALAAAPASRFAHLLETGLEEVLA